MTEPVARPVARPGPGRGTGRAPVAVALDTADLDVALGWARAVGPRAAAVKVGLELFHRHGPSAALAVLAAARGADREAPGSAVGGVDLFLDLKLHDIPNTVAGAMRSLAPIGPRFVTVHAAGGSAMVRAAVEAAPEIEITAVTVLTSLDPAALRAVGIEAPPVDAARRLAALAVAAGARAVVCSPLEVSAIRKEVGRNVTLITPGIRPGGSNGDDQARTATPEAALAAGADLLVMGRPITGQPDPVAALAAVAALSVTQKGPADLV
jgi:orotidine-5'-phosphate decarboxylase